MPIARCPIPSLYNLQFLIAAHRSRYIGAGKCIFPPGSRNYIVIVLVLSLFFQCLPSTGRAGDTGDASDNALPRLAVSSDGRYLVNADDGSDFFWLADTAWGMVNLTPDEVEEYLRDRASKGFNVIQGPILIRKSVDSSAFSPDYAGDLPLLDTANGILLNERYLQRVDDIVERARANGLYIVLAVVWGGDVGQVFSVDDPGSARAVGNQLGLRYKDKSNVIWIVCGEYQKIAKKSGNRKRPSPTFRQLALINALAEGIESGHGGANLMTIHPDGSRSSSEYFHDTGWLDFNMIQTFSINPSTASLIQADWERNPAKPVVNAEPAYEDRNSNYNNDPVTAWKVRYEAYQSVFQGAMGHTYGHWEVWQPSSGWRNALDSEGARSMGHLRDLMESRPATGRAPYQLMVEHRGSLAYRFKKSLRDFMASIGFAAPRESRNMSGVNPGDYNLMRTIRAMSGANGDYAFIYFPRSDLPANVNISAINGQSINAWWYNPRDGGTYTNQGERQNMAQPFATFSRSMTTKLFDPPGDGHEQDWVLVLDDASANYTPPGLVRRQAYPGTMPEKNIR